MGLDIYVGSFTRYYSGNWETVVQKYGSEQSLGVQVVRLNSPVDAITDPNQIQPTILSWRDKLSQSLGSNIDSPLDWDETDTAPYFTDKPAWDCYSSLLLWAAYSEHPELPRPHDCIEDWTSDIAFQRSIDPNFKSSFPQLLRDVEIWLPQKFAFTFRAADPTGKELGFGSSIFLQTQLELLNHRTWNATDQTLALWLNEGAEYKAPLEIGARFAFSIMYELAHQAVKHRLVMKLDY